MHDHFFTFFHGINPGRFGFYYPIFSPITEEEGINKLLYNLEANPSVMPEM